MCLDVIDAESDIVHEIRTDGPRPIDDGIVDWVMRELRRNWWECMNSRMLLAAMGITTEDFVLVSKIGSILTSN